MAQISIINDHGNWLKWGPYLSERQWGTIREYKSIDGSCWDYFPFKHSYFRTYKNGEDGLFGISDEKQLLCISLALWNEKDSILKERLFGLNNLEGNHGEDVKELYFYLDSTPIHSYMKALYIYPNNKFPYKKLIKKNKKLSINSDEYEIYDTGIFDDNAYCEILFEMAKEDEENILFQYTISNKSKEKKKIMILPTIFFRNVWSQNENNSISNLNFVKPELKLQSSDSISCIYSEGNYSFMANTSANYLTNFETVFTENETNEYLFSDNDSDETDRFSKNVYFKDGINNYILKGNKNFVNSQMCGTKASFVFTLDIPGNKSSIVQCRLFKSGISIKTIFGSEFNSIIKDKKNEADNFYSIVYPKSLAFNLKNLCRQAYAGLCWNKQYYLFNYINSSFIHHIKKKDIMAIPPIDHKIHKISNSSSDSSSIKLYNSSTAESVKSNDNELIFHSDNINEYSKKFENSKIYNITSNKYLDNAFGFQLLCENLQDKSNIDSSNLSSSENSLNIQNIDVLQYNERWNHLNCHHIMLMPDKWEFPWFAIWDSAFHAVAYADIDSMFAADQLLIYLSDDFINPSGQLPAYEFNFDDNNPPLHAWACYNVSLKIKNKNLSKSFLLQCFPKLQQNFKWWLNNLQIDDSMLFGGGFLGMDNISCINRSAPPAEFKLLQVDGTAWMAFFALYMMKIALELVEYDAKYDNLAIYFLENFVLISQALNASNDGLWSSTDGFFYDRLINCNDSIDLKIKSLVGIIPLLANLMIDVDEYAFAPKFIEYIKNLNHNKWQIIGSKIMLSLVTLFQLEKIFDYLFDEDEFLSSYGIRSLSKCYANAEYKIKIADQFHSIKYNSGISMTSMFGGNSNWRGPIWICMNFLLLGSMSEFSKYFSDTYKFLYPKNSFIRITLEAIINDIQRRLINIFTENNALKKNKILKIFQDYNLYYEFYDAETGMGCGASHQTGWTSLIAKIIIDLYKKENKKFD